MIALATAALVMVGCAGWAQTNKARFASLFGPPAAEMTESHAVAGSSSFDHSELDALLQDHVDAAGFVDYRAIAADTGALDRYISSIATADFDGLGRDDKLAFLINAYNAFTLRLILDHYPIASIKDIPGSQRWDHERWDLAGRTRSLNQIEHEDVRPKFAEPRIHFALVCAAVGCPPLRAEAYDGARLEEQLASQTAYVHTHDRWFVDGDAIGLTKLYDWYGGDFAQSAGSVEEFVAAQVPAVAERLAAGQSPEIAWLDYDWDLNDTSSSGDHE